MRLKSLAELAVRSCSALTHEKIFSMSRSQEVSVGGDPVREAFVLAAALGVEMSMVTEVAKAMAEEEEEGKR